MMHSNVILKVEGIGKQYRLGLVGTGTITQDFNRWWSRVRGKEDPYLKIGDTNIRSEQGSSNYVWALQNINFEVKQGEVLGIIGKNGAGKSTLLKILSRVTAPTLGTIKSKGRIASLLEVGTGFHPEMTGRENIYLNGAILGMTKAEISRKIDEIIDFSGCLRYIDTPVKRYSSGMTVRLAFAVAAHLEPDILVIDEVLAVGDAEFQKKAIGKMQEISKGEGRTVLFVSHNMAAVKNLCTRCIVLENGTKTFEGATDDAVDYYLKLSKINDGVNNEVFPLVNQQYGLTVNNIEILKENENVLIFNVDITLKNVLNNIGFGYKIKDTEDNIIGSFTPAISGLSYSLQKGNTIIKIEVLDFMDRVAGGKYFFDIWIAKPKIEMIIYANNIASHQIDLKDRYNTGVFYQRNKHGIINLGGKISLRTKA